MPIHRLKKKSIRYFANLRIIYYLCTTMTTIRFSVHRNPRKDADGNDTYQVRHECTHTINTAALEEHLKFHGIVRREVMETALTVLKDEIIEQLLDNRRLHLDGIGTFYLKIGFRERVDDEGLPVKVNFTDPKDITGNDVCVEGVGFTPDADFMRDLYDHPARFENVTGRGRVGHSVTYTREQIVAGLEAYLDEHDFITRREMMKHFGLTEYMACQWLDNILSMPETILKAERIGKMFVYKRR